MSNIGPGLSSVGPAANYAHIPDAGKVLLTFCMLVGRLEIYTILVVLSPVFWRR
jgi:trk system potassium uptake protein TrkH